MDHHPEGLEEVKNIPHEVSLAPCDILVITRRDGIRNENMRTSSAEPMECLSKVNRSISDSSCWDMP